MRALIFGVSLAMTASVAMAQYPTYRPYQPKPPATTSAYDWRSGNSYTTTTSPDGSATVRGNNYQNGAQWRTTIQPDGQQRGTDADGNMWRYDPRSKTYQNFGTGQICTGTGYGRVCN